jgi:hypothetical protein
MIADYEIPCEKMARDGDSRELLPDAGVNSPRKLAL